MDISEVILLIGLVFFVMSIKLLLQPGVMSAIMREIVSSQVLSLLLGIIPFVVGSVVLFVYGTHYSHDYMLSLLIFLGYLMVFVGLFRLWATAYWHRIIQGMLDKHSEPRIFVVILLMLSVALILIGSGIVI